MTTIRRLPISSRHAFALAFDLAIRRDLVHSLVVPLLLQGAWSAVLGVIPLHADTRGQVFAYTLAYELALLGMWFTQLLIFGMLRFRARSVFNSPVTHHPAPALECYREALERIAVLAATEVVRFIGFVVGAFLLFVPGLYVGFKFSMATETVVLRGERPRWRRELFAVGLVLLLPVGIVFGIQFVPDAVQPFSWGILAVIELAAVITQWRVLFRLLLRNGVSPALRRSFHLTETRWERWLEMIVISVMLILPIWFLMAAGAFALGHVNVWLALGTWLTIAALSVVQYAWTFFYLRLEESEEAGHASAAVHDPATLGPRGAGWRRGEAPHLRLVELEREDERQ